MYSYANKDGFVLCCDCADDKVLVVMCLWHPVPSQPYIVGSSSKSWDTLRVVWQRPLKENGKLRGYNIYWEQDDVRGHATITKDPDEVMHTHTISGLGQCRLSSLVLIQTHAISVSVLSVISLLDPRRAHFLDAELAAASNYQARNVMSMIFSRELNKCNMVVE